MTDVLENKDAHHEVTHSAGFSSLTSPSLPSSLPSSVRSSQSPSLQSFRSFSFSASRRVWVLGACAAAAALAFAGAGRSLSWIAPAFADAPAGGGLDAFLALSQRLTGRTGFDAVLGKRVYDALAKSDSQFSQNVAALNTWLQGHGGVPSDTVTQALQADQPALAKSVSAIMRAWYLGLVGDMPHVDVVAYEKALMFEPVKDVLTIPSYCRDVPFYWTQKPVTA
ncbi:sugar dehydrogenase complex small subunit [Paraburkholderia elongata]|uniref:Sorbitol dehydrogenase n=1 Tax=Paraburkholderia elongata TaxID=2675747 RepID=A0A972NJ55_9BURK|nr:sugar dehydrogenase complex small subunit [Paraburkholderia elongata]NPT53258.1 sorbitol dehydrogenase [Paraburkholderia elongata]